MQMGYVSRTRCWRESVRPTTARRRLILLFVLPLLVTPIWIAAPAVSSAQPGPTLELLAPKHVALGKPLELTLRLKHSRDVAGYEMVLGFDPHAANFSQIEQHDNDFKHLGRDIDPLTVVEVPYGAAIGLSTCPVPDCVTRQGAKQNRGGNGTITLARIVLAPQQAGLLQLTLGASKVVDVHGATLPHTLKSASVTVEVGGGGPLLPAPPTPWSLVSSVATPSGSVDLTGDGLVTNADAMEVALEWVRLREQGRACGELPEPVLDINRDGCIDVADVQLVASSYSPPTAGATSLEEPTQQAVTMAGSFVVNSIGDTSDINRGDGVCATSLGTCTLRAAMEEANHRNGPNLITFNIPGSGVQTITLTKILPTMWDESGGTTIDGYTQPGAVPNTDALISNAVIKVEVVGAGELEFGGLRITTANNVIRGLAFYKLNRPISLYGRGADNNVMSGNFVGTDAAGTYRSPVNSVLSDGIHLQQGSSGNLFGGTAPADRNVISGNGHHGISLFFAGTNGNRILGNLVGLQPNGLRCNGNRIEGIDVNFGAKNNIIGGTGPGERNVSSGNGLAGVDITHGEGTTGNQVIGNYLGTGVDGRLAPPACGSQRFGIRIRDGVNQNVFRDNVIGNNNEAGIRIMEEYTVNNTITNNRIGVAPDGTAIPNPVGVLSGGSKNTIGPNNVIAFNTAQGIRLIDPIGDRARITRNSIFFNGSLGIDIDPVGVTPNDPDDADTGPNEQLNFPVLLTATTNSVTGTACGGCVVEIFVSDGDPSGFGEGRQFVGSTTASADQTFVVAISGVSVGQPLTATATDANGNTSEFASNLIVGVGATP